METQIDNLMEKNLSPLRKLFVFTGFWAENLNSKKILLKLVSNIVGLFNLMWYSMVVLWEIQFMALSWSNITEVTAVIATIISGLASFIKLATMYFMREDLIYTIDNLIKTDFAKNIPLVKYVMSLEYDENSIESKYDQRIPFLKLRKYVKVTMDKKTKECKYILILNLLFVLFTLGGIFISPGAKKLYTGRTASKEGIMYLPLKASTLFDLTISPGYEVVFMAQLYVGILTIPGYSGVDTLFCWHMTLMKRQFEIIMHLLENLEEYAHATALLEKRHHAPIINTISIHQREVMEDRHESFMEHMTYKLLVECMDHYKKLLDIASKIDATFGFMIFFQMLSGSIVLCVVLFKFKMEPNDRFTYATYIVATLIQLAVYCFFGQSIINVSLDVSDSIYAVRWYKYSTKFQKTLIMLMRQSQRPVSISAMGYSTLSLPAFTSIISTTMSYWALVNSFIEEQ